LIVECDQSVGRKHDFPRMHSCHRHCLANGVEHRELAQGKIDIEPFHGSRRDGGEIEAGLGQQLATTRRI